MCLRSDRKVYLCDIAGYTELPSTVQVSLVGHGEGIVETSGFCMETTIVKLN